MSAEIIHVNAGSGYDIHIGKGLLDKSGELIAAAVKSRRTALITDSTVNEFYAGRVIKSLETAGFDVKAFTFTAGESSKNHKTLLDIYAFLASAEITRSDVIVALGGGVTGDMAGFAAATWQRGIQFVQIPTTLLAQVDSSIGGKTGIDLPEGKNLVGSFWQPSLVICDPDTLKTLDNENYSCGMAEVIKHACIRSRAMYETLCAGIDTDEDLARLIAANLNIKREVVERDTKETGERMLLNFGHTLGHALEKLYNFTGITHGEAVATGMVIITRATEKHGLTQTGTSDKLVKLLQKYNLPTETGLALADIVSVARGDKKRSGGDISLVVLKSIGEGFIYRLPVSEMPAFFEL